MGSARTGRRGAQATDRKSDPYAATAATLRAALVREIAEGGGLSDPGWRAAFEAVPRHVFVPHYYDVGGFGPPGGAVVYERLGGTTRTRRGGRAGWPGCTPTRPWPRGCATASPSPPAASRR